MKKIVLKLDLHDDKDKQKAMRVVSTIQGIDSIGMDMKERKMTVIGLVDPVSVVTKLRKFWQTDVVFIGPAKEEKKQEEAKKEEPKKEEPKKEEAKEEQKEEKKEEKKEEEPKKEENKEEPKKEEPKKEKREPQVQMITEFGNPYKTYYQNPYMTYNPYTHTNPYMNNNPYPATQYYYVQSAQENPNACTIL